MFNHATGNRSIADSPTTTGGVDIRSIISLVLEQLAFWQKHDPEFRFTPFLENSARLQLHRGIFQLLSLSVPSLSNGFVSQVVYSLTGT